MKTKLGKCRLRFILQPVSGKALPVYKGEILRITQIEGEQCVDFNCFNLDDYKEYMSVGHMRREAFHPQAGQFIWSNPPRYRPMMKILTMPKSCVANSLAARCSAVLFEKSFWSRRPPQLSGHLGRSNRRIWTHARRHARLSKSLDEY